jgi:O-glycosyl hydrolase
MAALSYLSRRRLILATAGLTAAAIAAKPIRAFAQSASTAAATQSPTWVSPDPAQVMQGFGAAGAWWPNDLVRFRPAVQESVADMLFGPDGIGLSVYRYNIGGGGTGVNNPVRAPETFLVSPGVYEWGRDPGGRLFLQMAAERGVPVLIGFVNSAPAVWTTTEGSCGGALAPGSEGAFASYLVDVVTHLRDVQGVTLSYLSPMNEPDYRFEGCGQEGMSVPPDQRATLVHAVGRELAARAPDCQLIADESSRTGEHFMREASQWLTVPGTPDYVAALAVHRYDYPNDLVLELADSLATLYDKPLWSTELCCFDSNTGAFGQQFDPTIRSALMMSNLMWQGMTVANDAAFHWWVACSSEIGADSGRDPDIASRANQNGWNDGLLYYDPNFAANGNQAIYTTKRYWAMGNFSRYVRPGDRRHDVTGVPRGLRVVAFEADPEGIATTGQRWTVVAINNAPAESDATELRLQLPVGPATRLFAETAVETSADRDLEPVDLPGIGATGMLSARLPAQSITTLQVRIGR